jgi:antitoxin PrlF
MTIQAKITSKGQITLPKELREAEGFNVGDTVSFKRNANGRFEISAAKPSLAALRGLVRYNGPRLSSDDIVDIIQASRVGKGKDVLEAIKRRGV